VPAEIEFRTKPQIAVDMIDRALANGILVSAWTCDELYGRDGRFLDALESRSQVFVAEIPVAFHGWTRKPKTLHQGLKNTGRGRSKNYPRLAAGYHSSEVRTLASYSSVFRKQSWQRYRIKDTDRGPVVWEVKWAVFWRKDEDGLPTRRHCLIVARNVLTDEVKYFLSNRVPGEINPVTGQRINLRFLLRVSFGRWSIESCFREGKEELGMDRASAFLRDTTEPSVLCSHASAVRHRIDRIDRSHHGRTSSQRHERLARCRGLALGVPS